MTQQQADEAPQEANAFQWSNDPDESFAWMIWFVGAGLRGRGGQRA